MMFGMKNLEWLGYPMVKKIEDMFIRFHMIHEHSPLGAALMHGIARQKSSTFAIFVSIYNVGQL